MSKTAVLITHIITPGNGLSLLASNRLSVLDRKANINPPSKTELKAINIPVIIQC